MKISASTEYAARIMFQLARLPAGEALSAEKLAGLENIPRAYVDQISQRLRHAGLLDGQRGAHGGYHLARFPSEISMGMIVRAADGAVFEDVCDKYSEGEYRCSHAAGGCDIRPVWHDLTALVEGFLDQVTLEQLVRGTARDGFGRVRPTPPMEVSVK